MVQLFSDGDVFERKPYSLNPSIFLLEPIYADKITLRT